MEGTNPSGTSPQETGAITHASGIPESERLPESADDIMGRPSEASYPTAETPARGESRVRALTGNVTRFMHGALTKAREFAVNTHERFTHHKRMSAAGIGTLALGGAAIGRRYLSSHRHAKTAPTLSQRMMWWKK